MKEPARVTVFASDYSYSGFLVSVFRKRRSDEVRVVVEDDYGRLFIHNLAQLRMTYEEVMELVDEAVTVHVP